MEGTPEAMTAPPSLPRRLGQRQMPNRECARSDSSKKHSCSAFPGEWLQNRSRLSGADAKRPQLHVGRTNRRKP